jgi:hypothetical protein
MEEEYCDFIKQNNLSPFNKTKTQLGMNNNSIYKTRDGKTVHNKLLSKISEGFIFADTSNLWHCLPFTRDLKTINSRQEFFKTINKPIKQSS